MRLRSRGLNHFFLSSVAIGCLALTGGGALARETVTSYRIPAQPLAKALRDFGVQSGMTIMADGAVVTGKRTSGYSKRADPETALRTLLEGTGLSFRREGSIFVVTPSKAAPSPSPSPTSAADLPNDSEIVVTAQKKEEKINDVPIAMTALSSAALDDRKIEGGSELLRAVPNVNFSKSNFSMYNFSIRGIGTKAVSASSDPAVAVSFNNTPLVRNRLFESEFFDMQRVEVLRGPQGTLYGRNATGGVVNLIPMLPEPDFGLLAKVEVGNFKTMRVNAMLNVPVTDTLGIRVAGALTSRDGFDYNTFTQKRVNGRELWSTRAIAEWQPSDRFRVNAIWQHFEEDDNRSRTGKSLCTRDPGPAKVGNVTIADPLTRGRMSQGCLPGSLYDDAAYGAPNGNALSYYLAASGISLGLNPITRQPVTMIKPGDPFSEVVQSRNLREIATSYDPVFRAKNDLFQVNMEFEPADGVKFVSQSAYARDRYYSSQDYNRFVSKQVFNDSSQNLNDIFNRPIDTGRYPGVTPGGIYCDPQVGCSDRLLSIDISRSRNRQWSQELRLQSDLDGPVNFNIGANYLDFKSRDDYYVFNNFFTAIADYFYKGMRGAGGELTTNPCPLGFEGRECIYTDPNPIDSLDNQGHNYFLSQNGVRIKSKALFGELYWNISDNLKLTIGSRYTSDKKISTQIPSQLLLAGGTETAFPGQQTGGRVNSGYPALDDISQKWSKFTGRFVIDWKPSLGFTDDTLVYFSASRGYKGGGTNPPRVDINPAIVQYQPLDTTFKPEYVNALEVGTKNSFAGGRFTLNATAFFYDYKDYQVSQIVDRIAYNENFDATIWGVELETAWRPSRAFRVDANLGYLRTRLDDGEQSIDVMDRTQGNPDWVVLRPWLQAPSNCVAPRVLVERILASTRTNLHQLGLTAMCPGSNRIGDFNPATSGGTPYHALFGFTYDPLAPYNPDNIGLNINQGGSGAPNMGRGFNADLSGNELPNSPRLTFNLGAQYTLFISGGDWELTLRGDYYRQSKSYARIYNTTYDRLRAWDNANLALTLSRPDDALAFQLYVKNLFNDAPITDAFTNADDTGLSTNVFTLDPRIIGFSVSKKF
ncbi:TonB-dependent receptor domain-containing protein [Sphingopyxis witflariensis]|uniref:TonB-denpendent receptor n=1 Tax=Sphingopyxis witflariensis TaxID=173675 RepID=A0A246K5J2_9SPHN|nr:TonB-dependent receptor [Sphingopyxis witflariensis]OWR01135.1 TonB-denpendent receptor [Sphingopyxis witflariensis]